MKNQYREALDRARREGKLVLVNFTGYACTNCHWMKANMFTRPEIAAAMKNFVLVELYTDGTDAVVRSQSEARDLQIQHRRRALLRDPRARRERGRHLPGTHARPRAIRRLPAQGRFAAACHSRRRTAALPQFSKIGGGTIDPNGKVAVVNFWGTFCVPCIQEIPSFNAIHREYASKGVLVVGVSMDDDASIVPPFLKKHPMDYNVGFGTPALARSVQARELSGHFGLR